jgi:hypothetical protein
MLLGQLHGVRRDDALSLSAPLNLDDRAYGDASQIRINRDFASWIMRTAIDKLQTEFLIFLGLKARIPEILSLVRQGLDLRSPDRKITSNAYPNGSSLEWKIQRPSGGSLRLLFWPSPLSRPPYKNNPRLGSKALESMFRACEKSKKDNSSKCQ